MGHFRITELWAYVAVDPKDGDEGVIGAMMPDGVMMPLVGADEARVKSMRRIAKEIGDRSGVTVQLRKFSTMTTIEEL